MKCYRGKTFSLAGPLFCAMVTPYFVHWDSRCTLVTLVKIFSPVSGKTTGAICCEDILLPRASTLTMGGADLLNYANTCHGSVAEALWDAHPSWRRYWPSSYSLAAAPLALTQKVQLPVLQTSALLAAYCISLKIYWQTRLYYGGATVLLSLAFGLWTKEWPLSVTSYSTMLCKVSSAKGL